MCPLPWHYMPMRMRQVGACFIYSVPQVVALPLTLKVPQADQQYNDRGARGPLINPRCWSNGLHRLNPLLANPSLCVDITVWPERERGIQRTLLSAQGLAFILYRHSSSTSPTPAFRLAGTSQVTVTTHPHLQSPPLPHLTAPYPQSKPRIVSWWN